MKVKLTLTLDIDGISEAGDEESSETLHSLVRSYYVEQYDGVDVYVAPSGLDAFEQAVIDTLTFDGIGQHAYDYDNPIRVVAAHIEQA